MVTIYDPKKLNKRLFLTMRQDGDTIDILLVDENGIAEPGGMIGYFHPDKGFVPYSGVDRKALCEAGFSSEGFYSNPRDDDKVSINIYGHIRI